VQLDDVPVVEDVVAGDHLAVVNPAAPDPGGFEVFGEVLVHFRGEFVTTLRIVQDGHVAPEQLLGSWAGAFGHTQFMPSTFMRTAVDFDGDGRRDIVGSVPDASCRRSTPTVSSIPKARDRTDRRGWLAASERDSISCRTSSAISVWSSVNCRIFP